MKGERDIEMILSNIIIRPDESAKKAAYKRMMARHKEIIAKESKSEVINLSEYQLEGVAAAGLPPEENTAKKTENHNKHD